MDKWGREKMILLCLLDNFIINFWDVCIEDLVKREIYRCVFLFWEIMSSFINELFFFVYRRVF